MAINPEPIDIPRPEQRVSLAVLIMGLFEDAKRLLIQEARLAKHEFQEELGKVRSAAVWVAIGVGLLALSGLLMIIMLVHMLQAFSGLPLWACYAIIGILIGVGGIVLVFKGKGTAASVHLVPQRTMKSMKENVTWIRAQSQKT
jgi:Putative Actinobacterial Holin-X, holin superfamily III